MRLKSFIVASLLLLCGRVLACGPGPNIIPGDNDLYRILPYYAELAEPQDGRMTANCRAWMRSVGGGVTEADVKAAVYDFSLREWLRVQKGDDCGNAFCRRLLARKDKEAIRLLIWSKYYEQWSQQMRSPWYYGCGLAEADGIDIDNVAAIASTYKGRYADRYLLLAMKCLYRSGRNEECEALWQRRKEVFKGSHLRDQAEGYLAACLNRMGRREEALDIYGRLGDAASLMLLNDDKVTVFEQMLRHHPNSPFFPIALQRVLFVVENYVVDNNFTQFSLDSVQQRRLLDLCLQAGSDSRVKNSALWRYTAACLYDHFGEPRQSLALVANLSSDDDFLNASIRVLRMHLHVQTDVVDDVFEQRMLKEVRWLDKRMQQEWLALDTASRFRLSHINGWGYNWDLYRTVYSNDALRRIVLANGGLYDRLRRAGRTTRALQLANMADNRFLQVSGNLVVPACRTKSGDSLYSCYFNDYQQTYNGYNAVDLYLTDTNEALAMVPDGGYHYFHTQGFFNYHDYSNTMFICADRLKADVLADYWQRVTSPRDDTDRWLNERGYTDADYWQDIIGTHLLREMRFDEAAERLSHVNPFFSMRLNTFSWMDHVPFAYDEVGLPPVGRIGLKFMFASAMMNLEHVASDAAADPNDRADARLSLSIGLRNAFGYRCWPLVAYGFDWYCDVSESPEEEEWQKEWWKETMDEIVAHYDNPLENGWYQPESMAGSAMAPYVPEAMKRAATLRREAFATYTDPDRKAQALRRVYEYTYLMKHYADTPTGQDIAQHCDEWKDYLKR